jgi:hypothetical protein
VREQEPVHSFAPALTFGPAYPQLLEPKERASFIGCPLFCCAWPAFKRIESNCFEDAIEIFKGLVSRFLKSFCP